MVFCIEELVELSLSSANYHFLGLLVSESYRVYHDTKECMANWLKFGDQGIVPSQFPSEYLYIMVAAHCLLVLYQGKRMVLAVVSGRTTGRSSSNVVSLHTDCACTCTVCVLICSGNKELCAQDNSNFIPLLCE